jgi:hypothetical protein
MLNQDHFMMFSISHSQDLEINITYMTGEESRGEEKRREERR